MVLKKFGELLGIKVEEAEKRGEIVLLFPPSVMSNEFKLKLSQKKALSLLSWIVFNNKKIKEEV